MGVGKPIDLVEAVARGIDMLDCVLPTRAGRHGQAWTWDGPINLKNARFAEDRGATRSKRCHCPASQDYSRAYLHHLIRVGRISRLDGAQLAQYRVFSGVDAAYARCDL